MATEPTKAYTVTSALGPRGRINGERVNPGDTVLLTELQAEFELARGTVVLNGAGPTPQPDPQFTDEDEITLYRGGDPRTASLADLKAYLAIGGVAPTPGAIAISTAKFQAGASLGTILAVITPPAGYGLDLETTFGGRVKLDGVNILPTSGAIGPATGSIRLRATSPDNLTSIVQTFNVEFSAGTGIPDTIAPVIGTAASFTVAENTPLVVTLTADEPVTWSLAGGDDASLWTLDANAATLTLGARDFENPADVSADNTYRVNIVATDASNNATQLAITANVTNVLEGPTPTLTPTTGNVQVAAAAGAMVLDLPAVVEGESRSFTPNDGRFVISPDGDLVRGNSTVTSGTVNGTIYQTRGGVTIDVPVTISISAAPDVTAPTITSAIAFSQAENKSLVINLTANEPVTFAKVGGTDAGAFALDVQAATLTLGAKDFDAPSDSDGNNTFAVQVRATDASGNASSQTITVTITNELDTPRVPLTAATVSMPYNTAANTKVLDLPPLVEGEARSISVSWLTIDSSSGDAFRNAMAGPAQSSSDQTIPVDVTTTQGGANPVTTRFSILIPAAGLALVPVGAVMAALSDGISSEGSAPGLRNMWGVFERRLGLRMQPSPVSLVAKSGTTIFRTLGSNTPWINPIAIDAIAAQKVDVPFFLTCGANDNVLSTDPQADSTLINDWRNAVTYHIAQNPQALRLPIMLTWPSGKTAEATYAQTVWNLQKAHLASFNDPRIVVIDTSGVIPSQVSNDVGLVHPHEIGSDKGAQLIMAAIEPHLVPATKAQILEMIRLQTYPKMGVQRDPDLALTTAASSPTSPVTGSIPTSKVLTTTTGSAGVAASIADTENGRKKMAIRAGGTATAAGIIKLDDKTALPLAMTPGQFAISGMGIKLPKGYISFGTELGSVSQSGSYQAQANAGITGPVAYDLDSIVIARPTQPAGSVATAKKTISARYAAGAMPDTDIEIEQPFAWVINDRTRHRPVHLGNVRNPVVITGTLTNQAGTLRVGTGDFAPAGMTESDFVERRIYKGGDATIGSGTLVATLTGATWTWVAAGLAQGDQLWAEVDANNGVGATRTARSLTAYLVP